MAFRLIVGLGNPTPRYEQTRHNAGFWFVEEIARRNRVNFATDSRSHGMLARLDMDGESVYLLKPMQFMNRSGGPVASLANFYKIEPSRILVAHDELDFGPGTVRLKVGGGHGGHNGLRDIIARLGSGDFARIRLGIGRPDERDDVVNYVLERPSRHDEDLLSGAIARAADLFPDLQAGKFDVVMNALHR